MFGFYYRINLLRSFNDVIKTFFQTTMRLSMIIIFVKRCIKKIKLIKNFVDIILYQQFRKTDACRIIAKLKKNRTRNKTVNENVSEAKFTNQQTKKSNRNANFGRPSFSAA